MSTAPLTLNLVQGSVAIRFSLEAAQELQSYLNELLQKLKLTASKSPSGSSRPTPQQPMEYRYTGDVFLEVFCNPNIWPSPFAAQVLITARDDRIKVNAEAELTRIIEDVNQYIEQLGS
ncbi:MAG: hypothetical protein HC835_13375 [Oscillatoriales cyanobacterium RM2_1_1]|nr:hypothetical protein [Oscillatoriales cyanobacterium SM2_3_0]NJO46536.1 hypothetical protein [Oscillatoriales cyanobacterium RM2_1_1]